MKHDSKKVSAQEMLKNFRKMIEVFDRDLIQTIAQRMIVSREIGILKKKNNIPVRDIAREADLTQFHNKCVKDFGADGELVDAVFTLILEASRKSQV